MRNLARMVTMLMTNRAVAAFSLPYSVDFSTLPDGPLPAPLAGGNWVISSAKAVNAPTLTEKILNGDFAAWTGGNADSWNRYIPAGCSVTESPAGEARFQGGEYFHLQQTVLSPSKWYQITSQCTAWTSGQVFVWPEPNDPIVIGMNQAETESYDGWMLSDNNGKFTLYGAVYPVDLTMDNVSAKEITNTMALLPATLADATAVVGLNLDANVQRYAGLICRADNRVNPQNYIAVIMRRGRIGIYKVVNGVRSAELAGGAPPGLGYADGLQLEARCTGTTIEAWYDHTQVASVTVNEPTINSNTIHGIFSTNGGNSLNSFFCHSSTVYSTVFFGGSNTVGPTPSTGFTYHLTNGISRYATSNEWNEGESGTSSWYGLIRLQTDVIDHAPQVVFIDFAVNDSGDAIGARTNQWKPTAEALIRRMRTAMPNTRLVAVNLVQQDEFLSAEGYRNSRDKWRALATKYGLGTFNIDAWLQGVIGDPTPTQAQCEVYGDFVHFTSAGHTEIYNMLAPSLVGWYPCLSVGWTGNLDDYGALYYADEADWEQTPQIINGADMTRGGTGWSVVDTTSIQSATANDTAAYTGTFCSFGLVTPYDGGFTLAWSIDSGAETQLTLQAPGITQIYNLARAEHTVSFRVVSGTARIDKFLAI